MSAAVEDMYLFSSSIKMEQQKQFRKRHHSDSSDDDVSSPKSGSPSIDDDRRAHHNELERRRRDHIKDHFVILKDAIPLLDGEKSSRALILKRAVEYIHVMQSRINENQRSIEELRRKNELLEDKLRDNTREPSVSPSNARIPTLGATQMQMSQITMPVPQVQQMPQIPQIAQIPQNPIALSAMDPAQLNSLIASSQDAIIALAQSLVGELPTPSLPAAASVSPPAGLYSTAFSPADQQMAVRF